MQYLTLLFIGCISASSLRGFLKNMSKVGCATIVQRTALRRPSITSPAQAD